RIISPVTPSSAPWAKHDDHSTHKPLHYTNSRNGAAIIGPNSSNTSSSSSLSTLLLLVHQYGSQTILLLKNRKNSERRSKKKLKDATSFILSNSGVISAVTNSMGKRYAVAGNGAK
ncbi:18899_t:CDS:2, partial [Funneliformis geosporum]